MKTTTYSVRVSHELQDDNYQETYAFLYKGNFV